MMLATLHSLDTETFFQGLEFETSVALENLNLIEMDKANEISKIMASISKHGMCKRAFIALEEISPSIMDGVNYLKLTEHPSKTYANIALETINKSSFFGKFSTGGGLGNFFIAFYDWLVSKLTGHSATGIQSRLHESWVKGRRRLVSLHDREKEIIDTVVTYKSEQVLTQLLKNIGAQLIKTGEYNAGDIVNAMIDICGRSSASSVPGLISLAKLAIVNNSPVSDYRSVAMRMAKHKNMLSNPAQSSGLGATRTGLTSSILIGKEIGIESNLGNELSQLSDQYLYMAKVLARMPLNDGGIANWINECEKYSSSFESKLKSCKAVSKVINRWTTDAAFSSTLQKLQTGVIGFWYNTQSNLQGDNVYDPDKYTDELRNVFEMNRSGDLDGFAKAVELTVSNMLESVELLKRIDQARLEKLIGNYNNNSSRLRNIIKNFRSDATTMLRISRIMESYVTGYVRAFKSVKPFMASYNSAVEIIYRTPIS